MNDNIIIHNKTMFMRTTYEIREKKNITVRSEDILIMRIGLGLDTDSGHYVLKICFYLQTLCICGFSFSEHLFSHHYHILKVILTTVWSLRWTPSSSGSGIWQGPTPAESQRSRKRWRRPPPTSRPCDPHLSPHGWASRTSPWWQRWARWGQQTAIAHIGPIWLSSQRPCSLYTCNWPELRLKIFDDHCPEEKKHSSSHFWTLNTAYTALSLFFPFYCWSNELAMLISLLPDREWLLFHQSLYYNKVAET